MAGGIWPTGLGPASEMSCYADKLEDLGDLKGEKLRKRLLKIIDSSLKRRS